MKDIDAKPRHLFFTGDLIDVPIMRDFGGVVSEPRQRVDIYKLSVLMSDKHIPEALVDILAPTIIPFKMEPGPVNGFYLVYMDENKTAGFHAVRQQDNDEDFDDEPFYGSPIDQSQTSQEQQQSQQEHEQLLQQKQQQEQQEQQEKQEKPQPLQNDKGKQPMRGSSIQSSNQLVRENVEVTFSAEGSLPFVSPNVSKDKKTIV